MKGINTLDNYFSNNSLPAGLDLDKVEWRILDTSDKFAKFYKDIGTKHSEKYIRENVAGFNSLSIFSRKTTIALNPELQSGETGKSNFGTEDRYAETAIHEFAHSLHRAISLDFGKKDALSKRLEFNQDYAQIAKQEVSWYAKQDYMEHFSEAFSKYLSTGEATPEFKQFLQKYIHNNNNKPIAERDKDGKAGESGERSGIGPEGQRVVPEGVGSEGRPDDRRADSVSDSPWSSLGDPLTPSDRVKELADRGKNTPKLYEIDAEKDAPIFRAALQKLRENNQYAASVYIYEEDEYKQMRLFSTADGKAGFALKNGNEIVSVYVHSDSEHKGGSRSLIAQAVALGGDRLDAFDTALPHIYATEGFRPISRVMWNDDYAPEGWDKELYQKFNNGSPDVVVMAYDPEKVDQDYVPGEGEYFQDYDAALEARDNWIENINTNKSDEDYIDAELTDLPRLDPDYTSDERNALRTYTSVENGRHREINTYLRTGEWVERAADDEKEQQRLLGVIEKLKNMINATSLPQNTKLVRYQRALPPGMDQVGAVWTSDGFLSTAAITADGLPVTNSFTGLPFEIEIKAPKGSKAGAIIGSFEGEVLLPPGSKFLVESVEKQGLKSVKIGLRLIEQNDSQPIDNSRIVEPGFENWIPEVFNIFDSIDLEEDQLGDRGNKIQSEFLEKAGFNGKPTVVSQEEFDAAEGEAIYRAVRSDGFVDDFINSPTQYAGEGSFGNGTYTTNKRESTEYYAGDTGGDRDVINARTIEMKLAPDANVLSFEEVPEMREWASKKGNEFLSRYIKAGANPAQAQEIDWLMNNDSDWTNLAIMSGIDAVRFKVPMTRNDEYYTIILNRGKVIVNGKS